MTESGVRGAARLQASLAVAAKRIADDNVNGRIAAQLATAARARAPRRTGALARSVVGTAGKQGPEIAATVVYAGVIHNGWPRHHISARPFIAQTVESRRELVTRQLAADTQAKLDQVRGA